VSSLLTPSSNPEKDVHFRRLAASTIMSIVYDYPTIMSEHDDAVEKIERYNNRQMQAVTPGAYFVEIFPWMKHIPERSESCHSFCCLIVHTDGRTNQTRFAKWKREGLRGFAEDSEMFRGLLNRVEVDLVRIYSRYDIWSPINKRKRPMGGTGQVSARL
jgi:hypothetical protein